MLKLKKTLVLRTEKTKKQILVDRFDVESHER